MIIKCWLHFGKTATKINSHLIEGHFSSPLQSIVLQRMKVERSMQMTCQVWGKSKTATFILHQKACNNRWAKSEKQATVNLKRSHQFAGTHMVRAARAWGRYGYIRKSNSPRALMLHGSVYATRHAGNGMATESVWKRLGSPDCAHIFVFSTAPFLNWSGITLKAGRSSLPVRIG